MLIIKYFDEFESHLGQELGVSDWHKINQNQINLFADATLDHQWIHTNPDKALTDSPFKKTIAHGYLTLSLIPFLWKQVVSIQNLKMEINYGIEKLKFAEAVTVDSEVRLNVKLVSIINLRGVTKANIGITLEIKDQKKPALSGEVVFLYHFN